MKQVAPVSGSVSIRAGGDAVQHVRRDGAPPLPCSSQVYQVGLMLARWGDLLPAQARRAPALAAEAECHRIQPRPAIAKKAAEPVGRFGVHGRPW